MSKQYLAYNELWVVYIVMAGSKPETVWYSGDSSLWLCNREQLLEMLQNRLSYEHLLVLFSYGGAPGAWVLVN